MSALFKAIENRDDYVFMSGFHHWVPGAVAYERMKTLFPGGYKLHLSADQMEAERVADAVLPLLRDLNVYHKIIPGPERYAQMNTGRQRGKFITIYSGPAMETFTRVVNTLDPILSQRRFLAGPRPLVRLAAEPTEETRIGRSGLLTYLTLSNFAD
jgi:hypothetical protein